MFCPNADCPDRKSSSEPSEFREEMTVCPFCGSHLVPVVEPSEHEEGLPEYPPKPRVAIDEEMEPVFETFDLTEAAVIKSLFDSAAIPYLAHHEEMYDAFRGLFAATVFNPLGRPIVFLVPTRMADQARQLLDEAEIPEDED
jgi:hypothetical protein